MIGIFLNKKILPLSLASFISKTGDFAYDIVFAIIAIELLSGDLFYLGVVYFFRFIPYLFFGPIGGWLADVLPKKHNMIFTDFFRGIITALIFLFYILDFLNIYILVMCSMLMTVGRSLFQPSFRAYLPSQIEKKDLPVANSLFQVIEDVASIVGPLVCSFIIIFSNKSYVLLMDSITYFLSVIILFFLDKNEPCKQNTLKIGNIFSDTNKKIRSMHKNNQDLFYVIIGTSGCVLFTAALLRYVLPASIINIYDDEKLVGFVFSLMAVGTVIGGLLYTSLVKNTNPNQLMKAWMLYGVLFFIVSLVIDVNFILALFVIFLLGFSGAIVDISIITNIQSLSSKHEIGKNYGLYSTVANTCEAASGLITGLFSMITGGASFAIMALLITGSGKIVIHKLQGKKKNEE